MISHIKHHGGKVAVAAAATVGVVALTLAGSGAFASPPYAVTYFGTPVTTAVPGKPFTVKFQVKNTGSTEYSGVKVVFHIPGDLSHTLVSPANAEIEDGTITWTNVPIAAGKSFYPSLTLTLDSGAAIDSKRNIWVEVIGADMEANSKNFSITAKRTAAASSTLSSADVSGIFQSVYGRTPTASELRYWLGRRTDKPGRAALTGAMGYHKVQNIAH